MSTKQEACDTSSIEKKPPSVNEIFKNDIRFELWGLFSMYPELTLADISEKMGKSKSTIHPHLKLLEEMDIIEEIREEKVRGSIKAKVYALKKGYDEILARWGNEESCRKKTEIDQEMATKIANQGLNMARIKKKTLEMEISFWEKILSSGIGGPDEHAIQMLNEMYELNPDTKGRFYKKKESLHTYGYFSNSEYIAFKKLFAEFFKKLNEVIHEEERDNPNIEKPFYFFGEALPLKRMYEYLHPPTAK